MLRATDERVNVEVTTPLAAALRQQPVVGLRWWWAQTKTASRFLVSVALTTACGGAAALLFVAALNVLCQMSDGSNAAKNAGTTNATIAIVYRLLPPVNDKLANELAPACQRVFEMFPLALFSFAVLAPCYALLGGFRSAFSSKRWQRNAFVRVLRVLFGFPFALQLTHTTFVFGAAALCAVSKGRCSPDLVGRRLVAIAASASCVVLYGILYAYFAVVRKAEKRTLSQKKE